MSLKGFQQAVVELTLAPKWFRALRRGESTLLERYDLNERERNRLLDIARQPGVAMNCSLARGNRLELIVAAFPKTCTLLKPRLPRLLDELWEQHQPDNYQLFGEEDAFAAFIGRKIDQGELPVEYLAEIFAYEMARRDLAIRLEMSTGADAVLEAIVEFQHAPDQLLPPLSRLLAPPAGLPCGVFQARVRLREAGFEVDFLSGLGA
jgi:hypothetical protein